MFTAICIPSFGMNLKCTIYCCKYWVALNPGLGGVGSNMHFHYCSWTGSNQTEPAIFSYLSCSVAFKVRFSSIYLSTYKRQRKQQYFSFTNIQVSYLFLHELACLDRPDANLKTFPHWHMRVLSSLLPSMCDLTALLYANDFPHSHTNNLSLWTCLLGENLDVHMHCPLCRKRWTAVLKNVAHDLKRGT
jgi:hypothetical protein